MFLPDNFNLDQAHKYIFTLRIKQDGISLLISDPEDKSRFHYREKSFSDNKSILENLQQIIFDYNFFSENYRRVNVIIASPNYEVIPEEYFDRQRIKDSYNFTHNNVLSHILQGEQNLRDNKIVFEFDEEAFLFLKRTLFNPVFYHHAEIVSGFFLTVNKEEIKKTMHLNLHGQIADIVCFDENNKLINIHSYRNEHEMDLIYFILSFWTKLGYDQLSDKLYIWGKAPSEKFSAILKDYIQNISYRKAPVQDEKNEQYGDDIPLDILIISE